MYNEAHNELLDAEFRQILYMIKPLINNINNHYHLEYYRLWLERLSVVAHPVEKLERNKYLLLLANQIHDNALSPPFTSIPPKGLLPHIRKIRRSLSKISNSNVSEQEDAEKALWSCVSPRRSPMEEKKPKIVQPFQRIGKPAGDEGKTVCDEGKTVSDQEKTVCVEGKTSDHSSWCDISESVSPTETDVDDNKIRSSLQETIDILKAQGEPINEEPEDELKEGEVRRPTREEIEGLKMRMKDLLDVTHALRDTQCLTENRKKTIDTLQIKLAQAEKENVELKAKLLRADQQIEESQTLLDSQQKKFMEMDQVKSKELHNYKEKFTILRRQEVEYLNESQKKEIASLEEKHRSKVSELEAQISALTKEYEEKIKEMKDSNMSVIQEKEAQIQELRSELQVRSSQIENEGNGEQIHALKRCISKLDKTLHKNEKDYVKKIERLKQELDVKEMTSQMQLQTQRADLLLQNSTSKQEELHNALNSLEGKYKKMLESVQSHALEVKKQDENLIDSLKSVLHRNNISYN